ncbi:MAG TPA: RNA methyltransferase [Ktedonobacteraceae bacterium]|nr:RNA methyltransferase [Ktedonobacteraceae bacterium]
MIITSQSNRRVKQIRSLRDRKEREETGLFFVEGIRIVVEAVQAGAEIEMLVVAPDLLKSQIGQETVRQEQERGIPVLEVSAQVFKSLSVKEGPQGIGAVLHERWEPLDRVRLTSGLVWVALDAAQDPGNIGTIMRTNDAVGGTGIMLLGNCADPYDPSALRASMGAIFSQRLVKASFADFARWKERYHYTVVGTSDSAKLDYREARYHAPLVLLMGSERQGLSVEQQAVCDMMVCIPMVGRSDSLNLSVATGIVLYEVFYQHRHE